MNNGDVKTLALNLLHADSEAAVIEIVRRTGLWDQEAAWRLYGDRDTNYATIGNQQSRPEAALVEKLVNSVDARLLNECLVRGVDPESAGAPQSVQQAVAYFFEGRNAHSDSGGHLADWPADRLLQEAQKITLAITGATAKNGNPCVTIADCGEGQTPNQMPATFLSLTERSNKLRVPFVQGKFNMGGTGVLKFCGTENLQLILTRRNPAIPVGREPDTSVDEWGVTLVRRERPRGRTGEVRNSVFRYLAPIGADRAPGHGDVLRFRADRLPILPERNLPYARDASYGSVIKLYEYDMKGFRSHALMKGGLLSRLEILLPEIALPIRVHECRPYRGDQARSFANSLVGLSTRLAENRGDNLEPGYPASVPFSVSGEQMVANIYAFRDGRAESYRTNEGIIFIINGQTHGAIPKTFFDRTRVKMGRLSKSLLLTVDCSRLTVGAREDLFMNSRDRLSNGELRKSIEEELEDIVAKHPGLRALREERRRAEVESRLNDAKPLEDVLADILKVSPTLSRLFVNGQRLSRPFRGGAKVGGGSSVDPCSNGNQPFVGRAHPTMFHFTGRKAGEDLHRSVELGRRVRIKFDTDVVNEYFGRAEVPGHYNVEVLDGPLEGEHLASSIVLHDGTANWSITIPDESIAIGDVLTVQCSVSDDTLVEPFVNVAKLSTVSRNEHDRGNGTRKGRRLGSREQRGGEGTATAGFQLPTIVEVSEGDTNYLRHSFTESAACKMIEDAVGPEDNERSAFTFYVNVSNRYLMTEMKATGTDPQAMRAKFVYGNVLIGLALLHDRQIRAHEGNEADDSEVSIAETIEFTTRALAPFLIPMIEYLGGITELESAMVGQVGDDD